MNSATMQETQAPACLPTALLGPPVSSVAGDVIDVPRKLPGISPPNEVKRTRNKWVSMARAYSHKTTTATIALVKRAYGAIKRRYGPRYSKALLIGVFIALFLPIPGGTLLVIGIIAAIAECHRVVARTAVPERLRRIWTAIKRGILGKSSDAYMKQFSGDDEYWDRVIAVQAESHPQQPATPDTTPEFEPVHGWTKRQLDSYLARNPAYQATYETKLRNTQQ